MTEYILYVAQYAHFQPRTMLIPAKEYLESNKADCDLLRSSTSHTDGVDNLLLHNYVSQGSDKFVSESTLWMGIISKLNMYTEDDSGNYPYTNLTEGLDPTKPFNTIEEMLVDYFKLNKPRY